MPPRYQPNPELGVFETMLVLDGEPVEPDAHLARLAGSLRSLYGLELPTDTSARLQAAAANEALGRLRLTATPTQPDPGRSRGTRLELTVSASPVAAGIVFPRAERGTSLVVTDLPGGLGPHKWMDRRGLDRPEDGRGPLIADGPDLLEAGWANLFAVEDRTVRTPPTDGRILPGITREAVLELATGLGLETREEPLHREDLHEAAEVFLTNSIRGIEPALSLDGAPLAGGGPLSRRLGDGLRRRWRLHVPTAPAVPAAAPLPGPPAH
jgi:para-aminobenzoate synthetase / 4-amino-4-deoxychorismate lyase